MCCTEKVYYSSEFIACKTTETRNLNNIEELEDATSTEAPWDGDETKMG